VLLRRHRSQWVEALLKRWAYSMAVAALANKLAHDFGSVDSRSGL